MRLVAFDVPWLPGFGWRPLQLLLHRQRTLLFKLLLGRLGNGGDYKQNRGEGGSLRWPRPKLYWLLAFTVEGPVYKPVRIERSYALDQVFWKVVVLQDVDQAVMGHAVKGADDVIGHNGGSHSWSLVCFDCPEYCLRFSVV